MIRGVLFDLDGTLVDTLDEITSCLDAALEGLGAGPYDRNQVRQWVGNGVDRLVERALGSAQAPLRGQVLERIRKGFAISAGDGSRPYDGIAGLLDELAQRDLVLGVITNKPHDAASSMVDRFFPGVFLHVQGVADGGPRKPSSTAMANALAGLGLAAGEVLLVGDSEVDIETGRRSGIRTVGVTWGFRGEERLVAEGPDWLISEPRMILEVLAQCEAVNRSGVDA